MLADPYFAGVESFRPERKKTALLFHGKDDLPEVRYRVFNLLCAAGSALRFHAVVCDKQALLKSEMERRTQDSRGSVFETVMAANRRNSRPGFRPGSRDLFHSTTPAYNRRTLRHKRAEEKAVVSIEALKTFTARGRVSLTTGAK